MAENKKSFVMYADWQHTVKELTDEEAGKILKHLLSYVNDENPILEDRILKLVFEPIKLQLKRDLQKYELIKEKRSEAGRQGGLASGESRSKDKQTEANEANASQPKQTEANEAVNDNVTVNVNDTDIVTVINNKIDFEFVWELYDKKKGDKDKLKIKWDKLSFTIQQLIIEHIPKYKKEQPDKQFRKNFETYLNNKSYNDEILTDAKDKRPHADRSDDSIFDSPADLHS